MTAIFIGFCFLFLYLPGRILTSIAESKKTISGWIQIGIGLILGLVILTIISLILSIFHINWLFLWFLPLISIIWLYKSKEVHILWKPFQNILKERSEQILGLVLMICVTSQCIGLLKGGLTTDGILAPQLHDTMWNLALMGELLHHSPAQHPGFSGELLKNNHYFYPLFLAAIKHITGMDSLFLYYKAGPLLVSLLYGLGLYGVISILVKSKFIQIVGVFLGFYAGSLSFVLPILLRTNFNWQGNTFLADQPFDQIANPYTILGFALFLWGFYWLVKILNFPHQTRIIVFVALIFGSLYGFKSFGGVIAVGSLMLTALITLRRKNNRLLITAFLTLLVFLPVFFLISDMAKPTLVWQPGWLLRELVVSSDKLQLGKLADMENYYSSIGNSLGLLKIKALELTIYIVGNFGVRLLGILYGFILLWKLRSENNDISLPVFFLLIIFSVSFSLPLLFNLGGNAHNIIQFTPYAFVISAIFLSMFMDRLWTYCVSHNKQLIGLFIIASITSLAIPVNIKQVLEKVTQDIDVIPQEEFQALAFIKNNSTPEDVIAVDYRFYPKSAIYVSALTERRLFLSDTKLPAQTLIDPSIRVKINDQFFTNQSTILLDQPHVAYVYLLKSNLKDIKTDIHGQGLTEVYANSAAIVLKINR